MSSKNSYSADYKSDAKDRGNGYSKDDDKSMAKVVSSNQTNDSDSKDLGIGEDVGEYVPIVPQINVTSIQLDPSGPVELSSPLQLKIIFELDRDAIAANWIIQFLVDSTHNRIIKILGETPLDDYIEGSESEMEFNIPFIDVSGIPPSTLTNSGLLMAKLMLGGEEVASVNMVVNVYKQDGKIVRDILNPIGQ
eukprot:gene16465-22460_t